MAMDQKPKNFLFVLCMAVMMPIGYGLAAFVFVGFLLAPFILLTETLTNFSYEILLVDIAYFAVLVFLLSKYGRRIPKMIKDFLKQIWNNY